MNRPAIALLALICAGALGLYFHHDSEPATPAQETPSAAAAARTAVHRADPELAAFTGDLDAIRERGVLRALVTPSRTNFFVDDGEIRGVQAEFLYRFVAWLNRDVPNEADRLRLKFVPVPFHEQIPALLEGRGDLIAAFLTLTPERAARIDIASEFRLSANEVVVTHADVDPPESLEALAGRSIVVLEGSSYDEHLRALSDELQATGLAAIDVQTADARVYTDDILELVNAGAITMTLVDDYAAHLWARVLPNIRVHDYLAVTQDNPLGWGLRPGAEQLGAALDAFAGRVRQGSLLGNILFQRYFEDTAFIDNPLERAKRDRLEALLPLFQQYGTRYGIEPLALAAQAYQESAFDQDARSGAGAVGIMQLLPTTAADPQVAIADIEVLENNIHAGARYMAFLRDRYFDDPAMASADRQAFTLAAYNAGPRAIQRVRNEAAAAGLDPNVWYGQTEISTARAIGREPVRYVANVQKFHLAYRLARSIEAERDLEIEEFGSSY
ncbi:MAG TPA: transporter substrate-binding domain-containing protein [Pseudomonadales bacterium]|nr:transporter substrate-binding domain-containing protein [Pseudomonadales bacterium]